MPQHPPSDPPAKPDTLMAIGQIQFGNAGCTATIIGPRRPDGRWNVLTAAHCLKGQPSTGKMRMKSGRLLTLIQESNDERSDVGWCITLETDKDLPFALIADDNPKPGDKIWHAGYGVHIPGNREDGTVLESENSDGQTRFRLSVSSGDSGGGIALNADGKIVSSVCCTTNPGGIGDVWGCSVASIRKTMPKSTMSDWQWVPTQMPAR